MAGNAEQGVGSRRPGGGIGQARVTTVRRATIIAVLVALIAGAVGSVATAQLTNGQSDVSQQKAQVAQLTDKVSQQQAQIAQLTGDATNERDRLNAEIATLKEQATATAAQVKVLEADKAKLQKQLAQILNPTPGGPTPAAVLTAVWVRSYAPPSGPVAICVQIENTSASDVSISYSYSEFVSSDRNNFVYPPRLHTPGVGIQLTTPLLYGQLGRGEKRRGELLYDVPDGTTLAKLAWSASFGKTPKIAVDLPATSSYGGNSRC